MIQTAFGTITVVSFPAMAKHHALLLSTERAEMLVRKAMRSMMEEHFSAPTIPDYLHMPVTPEMPPGHPAVRAKALHPGWISSTAPEACASFTEADNAKRLQENFSTPTD